MGNVQIGMTNKEQIRIANSDGKGRIVLGSAQANKMFRISSLQDGNLLLEPVVAIHERDASALVEITQATTEPDEIEPTNLGSFFDDNN